MFNANTLAILIIETAKDKPLIPDLMADIKTSLFGQTPTFIVVSGEGQNNDLSVALNTGIQGAIEMGCEYVFWAHPDMKFNQPNWHLPLIEILDECPICLKVCAANSRDPIGPLRLDQEQSWMMRTSDFEKFENLWFNHDFKRIGGFEDWYQSWSIITSGFVVVVTPKSQVWHAGMGTRKLRDTVQEQQDNSVTYQMLTGTNENPHQWKFFGKEIGSLEARRLGFELVATTFPTFREFESHIQ